MNEVVFLIKVLAEFATVFVANRIGKEWVVATIGVNLILISVLGAKVVAAFGFVTNAGNVFYAGVFLALQVLVERYGRKEAKRAAWLGFWAIGFFLLMSAVTQLQTSADASASSAGAAISALFTFVPRIAFASIVAFLFAQTVNIRIYDDMRMRMGRRHLWARSFMATVAGQLVDSVLFFYLAFAGVLPNDVLVEALVVGFIMKSLIGAASIPVLYATRTKIEQLI